MALSTEEVTSDRPTPETPPARTSADAHERPRASRDGRLE
jgi:hypothetical protein